MKNLKTNKTKEGQDLLEQIEKKRKKKEEKVFREFVNDKRIKKILTKQLRVIIEEPFHKSWFSDPTLLVEAKELYLLKLKQETSISYKEIARLSDLSILVSFRLEEKSEVDKEIDKVTRFGFPVSESYRKDILMPKLNRIKEKEPRKTSISIEDIIEGNSTNVYLTFPGKTTAEDFIIKLDFFDPDKWVFKKEVCHWRQHCWIPLKGSFNDKICAVCGKISLQISRLKKHPEREAKEVPFSRFDVRNKEGNIIPPEEYFLNGKFKLVGVGEYANPTEMFSDMISQLLTKKLSKMQEKVMRLLAKGESLKDIAQMVGLNYSNVRKIKQRASKKIKKYIKK